VTSWHVPRDLEDALAHVRNGATPVAGATALYSAAFPPVLGPAAVDVRDVLGRGVDDEEGAIVLGASLTIAELAADPRIRAFLPALATAAAMTANPHVRRVATLGGTIAARLLTADLAAPLAAHHGVVLAKDAASGASLEVGAVEYFGGAVDWPHLVTGVRLERPGPGAYRRFAPLAGPAPAFATLALVRSGDVLVGFAGAVGPTAAPVSFAAGHLPGAGELRDDRRASSWFRARLLEALSQEAHDELGRAG